MPRWLGLRLSLMFFLDVGVTAAYFPLLAVHLTRTLGLSPKEVGVVFAMGPLATLIAPLLVGSLADRVWSAERALSLINLLRALSLVAASQATSFGGAALAIFLVGFVSAPGGVLDFTIAFHHLRGRSESVGKSRVFGTVSWIFVLWAAGAYFDGIGSTRASTHSLFLFAAAIAALSSLYALTLPHTPPLRGKTRLFAFLDAARLLRRRDFRAVVVAAALAAMCTQFHFVLHPLFYSDPVTGLGLDLASTSRASSVAQLLEVGLFPLLGGAIARFGLRRVLVFGMLAWPLRFFAYALGGPAAFVIGAQTLHGVNVVFGMVAGQVAVDRLAPAGARASSQALLTASSIGAGNLLGQLLCGVLLEASALPSGGYRWPFVFAVPLVLGALAAWIVLVGLRDPAPVPEPQTVA
jgi:MFS family permease